MIGTPAYAVFYALLAVLFTWLTWFLLWRDYRKDLLRHRLDLLAGRFSDDPEFTRLVEEAGLVADRLTWTRFLLCRLLRKQLKTTPLPVPAGPLVAVLASHFRPLVPTAWIPITFWATVLVRKRQL